MPAMSKSRLARALLAARTTRAGRLNSRPRRLWRSRARMSRRCAACAWSATRPSRPSGTSIIQRASGSTPCRSCRLTPRMASGRHGGRCLAAPCVPRRRRRTPRGWALRWRRRCFNCRRAGARSACGCCSRIRPRTTTRCSARCARRPPRAMRRGCPRSTGATPRMNSNISPAGRAPRLRRPLPTPKCSRATHGRALRRSTVTCNSASCWRCAWPAPRPTALPSGWGACSQPGWWRPMRICVPRISPHCAPMPPGSILPVPRAAWRSTIR
ncbi:hypothetical protein D3C72_903140 [compost metagenome]